MNAKELTAAVEALTATVVQMRSALIQTVERAKIQRAEILSLRAALETATIKPRNEPAVDRISAADWDLGVALLKAETGKNFHAPSLVRGRVAKFHAEAGAKPVAAPAPVLATSVDAFDDDTPF